jgi:hypothetical protein
MSHVFRLLAAANFIPIVESNQAVHAVPIGFRFEGWRFLVFRELHWILSSAP